MQLILGIIKFFLQKTLSFVVVIGLAWFAWNMFSHREDKQKFIVSFPNVAGLSRGAPIYMRGVEIGKVIKVFPLANANGVAVEGLVTKKDLSIDNRNVNARIINDVERGGGQVLEITSCGMVNSGSSPDSAAYMTKYATRLLMDSLQMTKDFANQTVNYLSGSEAVQTRENIVESAQGAVRSVEYGFVKDDLKTGIKKINKDIKNLEISKEEDPESAKAEMADQVKALSNTLSSLKTVSDVYKK
jgi:hypothetical protein